MKLNPKFLTHETKGEHITVSTTGTKFNGLIRSNSTAAFIVESLKSDTTESEIVDKMLAKYDVDRDTAIRCLQNTMLIVIPPKRTLPILSASSDPLVL